MRLKLHSKFTAASVAVLMAALASPAAAETCISDSGSTICNGTNGGLGQDGETIAAPTVDMTDTGDTVQTYTIKAGDGGPANPLVEQAPSGGSIDGTADLTIVGAGYTEFRQQGGHGTSVLEGENGNGGNAAGIDFTASGTGNIVITNTGGRAGYGGPAAPSTLGTPGATGDVDGIITDADLDSLTVTNNTGGIGLPSLEADAGDVALTVASDAKVDKLKIQALGTGENGDVTLVINGEVGKVSLQEGAGNIGGDYGKVKVVLNDGAVVTDTIINYNATGTLEFAFKIEGRDALTAAEQAIANSGSSGTIIINGKSYSWQGFDQLVNRLSLIDNTPTDPTPQPDPDTGVPTPPTVVIIFDNSAPHQDATSTPTQGGSTIIPTDVKCSGTQVKASYLPGNVVQLIANPRQGDDFVLGTIANNKFAPANDTNGWTAEVKGKNNKNQLITYVTDASGNRASICKGPVV